MAEWKHGICGCFDDIGTLAITMFLPCVTFGENAVAAGLVDSCFLGGLFMFVPFYNIYLRIMMRKNIRESRGIEVR